MFSLPWCVALCLWIGCQRNKSKNERWAKKRTHKSKKTSEWWLQANQPSSEQQKKVSLFVKSLLVHFFPTSNITHRKKSFFLIIWNKIFLIVDQGSNRFLKHKSKRIYLHKFSFSLVNNQHETLFEIWKFHKWFYNIYFKS